MIMKWLLRILYVILVLFASLYILQMGYISRNNLYYVENVKDHWDDTEVFLDGVSTLQYLDYYQETPIYTFSATSGENKFDLNVYAIGITYQETFYNGYMIFINNVEIYENGTLIENPIIKLTVNVTADTIYVDNGYQSQGSVVFDPTSDSFYGNTPLLMLFDVEGNLINGQGTDDTEDDVYSEISKITIDYSNRTTEDDTTYLFNSETDGGKALFVGTNGTVNDPTYYSDDSFVINQADYRLSEQFIGDTLSDADITTLGLITPQGDLTENNWEVWKTMLSYTFFIIIVSYFLFFHKLVKAKVQEARAKKLQNDAPVNAIFKDIIYDETKDGK